jgi:hypothetical protein
MATVPNYASTPYFDEAQIATANTARDGTGTLGTLAVGANGSRIDELVVAATGTTTAGMIRFFIYDGSTTRFWFEVAVSAITASASVSPWRWSMRLENFSLPASHQIKVGTNNAETFNCMAFGGSY